MSFSISPSKARSEGDTSMAALGFVSVWSAAFASLAKVVLPLVLGEVEASRSGRYPSGTLYDLA